ncbi:hypothetical protein DM01DRAFT_1376362 [Hesseltinella vesiculosa]|uniref:Uncharacterized protein n=1 Tax=Hesseltinella vesiculosa TaxID=101127 RepID=A0A1X2GAZ2_9FUNG|nr:hypothetical protein DM01DRAFT_1376362 [Hesseltinella vesiculosa]
MFCFKFKDYQARTGSWMNRLLSIVKDKRRNAQLEATPSWPHQVILETPVDALDSYSSDQYGVSCAGQLKSKEPTRQQAFQVKTKPVFCFKFKDYQTRTGSWMIRLLSIVKDKRRNAQLEATPSWPHQVILETPVDALDSYSSDQYGVSCAGQLAKEQRTY